METKFIFESFKEWYTYLWKACKYFAKGIFKIVYSLIMGIVSVFVFCGKQVEAFCRREPIAAGIVGMLFFVLTVGWCFTFVNGRAATKTAEHQRDSIGYKLDMVLQAYDSTSTIVIGNDTIRHGQGFHP